MAIKISQGGEFYTASSYSNTTLDREQRNSFMPRNTSVAKYIFTCSVIADRTDPWGFFSLSSPQHASKILKMKRLRLHKQRKQYEVPVYDIR
jgi:hypothetical protein